MFNFVGKTANITRSSVYKCNICLVMEAQGHNSLSCRSMTIMAMTCTPTAEIWFRVEMQKLNVQVKVLFLA